MLYIATITTERGGNSLFRRLWTWISVGNLQLHNMRNFMRGHLPEQGLQNVLELHHYSQWRCATSAEGSCKHIQLTERATYSSKHEPQLEKGGPYSNPYSRRRCIGNCFIAELHFRKLILEFSSRWISDMVLHAKACIAYIEGIRALHLYISIVLLVPTASSFIKFV